MDSEQEKRERRVRMEAAARRLNFDLADWERRMALAKTGDELMALALELPDDPERPLVYDPMDDYESTITAPVTTSTPSTSTTPTAKTQGG